MRLRAGERRQTADYTASMTDISYLLIIFLVLCAAFAAGLGLRLRLPDRGTEPQKLTADQVVSIVLAEDGTATIDGGSGPNRAAAIAGAVEAKPGAVVLVEIAGALPYRAVLDVLAEAKDAGAERFSLRSTPRTPVPVKVEEPDED